MTLRLDPSPEKIPSAAKREGEGPWSANPQTHIVNRLQSIFRDVFDNDDLVLHPAMTAADIPAWDSLTNINLIIASEIAFGIRLKPREISALANVGDMVQLISRAMQTGARR